MIRDKHVRLLWIQQLEPAHFHVHATEPQPVARAEQRDRIYEVVIVDEPRI